MKPMVFVNPIIPPSKVSTELVPILQNSGAESRRYSERIEPGISLEFILCAHHDLALAKVLAFLGPLESARTLAQLNRLIRWNCQLLLQNRNQGNSHPQTQAPSAATCPARTPLPPEHAFMYPYPYYPMFPPYPFPIHYSYAYSPFYSTSFNGQLPHVTGYSMPASAKSFPVAPENLRTVYSSNPSSRSSGSTEDLRSNFAQGMRRPKKLSSNGTQDIILCGYMKSGIRIHEEFCPFFGFVVEIFVAESDPSGIPLFRSAAIARKLSCPTNKVGMYLARRRRRFPKDIVQASAFKHKRAGSQGLKLGGYFVSLTICQMFEHDFLQRHDILDDSTELLATPGSSSAPSLGASSD